MLTDSDEVLEDFLDSIQFEVVPGDIWGSASRLYLVVQHEECGCAFFRAVALTGSFANQLIAERDDDLVAYFLESGFAKVGHIDCLMTDASFTTPKKPVPKKQPKKTAKTKTSKRKRR